MIHKIKLLPALAVLLAAIDIKAVCAEDHIVQHGEVLSLIAEQKRVQSGFLLSTEQIMLTLYQLNKEAFLDGNINHLAVATKLFIPDNTADYVQISKAEAQRLLRDKGYLSTLGNAPPSKTPEYTQILKTLESHQNAISSLQAENKRLTTKFDLLERTLGRVVTVQGLLTNNMVQVRIKLMALLGQSPGESLEKLEAKDSSLLELDSPKIDSEPTLNSNLKIEDMVKTETPDKAVIKTPGNTSLQTVSPEAIDESIPSDTKAPKAELASPPPMALEAEEPNKIHDTMPPKPLEREHTLITEALTDVPSTKKEKAPNEQQAHWLFKGALTVGFFLVALVLWWGVNVYRAKKMAAQFSFEENINEDDSSDIAPIYEVNHFNDEQSMQDEVLIPVKTIIEKSQKAVKEAERENELGDVLELLDMCLLCGDYEQAHAVTVKALAEHHSSKILNKKLSFIERKMAKL